MTGPHEVVTRRRALAGLAGLAGLTGTGCASSKASTPGVTARPKPGALLWRRSQPLVNGESVLGVVPAGGVVCVGDGFGNIYGLNAATGRTLWRRTFSDNAAGYLPLAAADGRVFAVGSMRVAALSAATGQQLWSVPAAGVEPNFPPRLATYFVVYANGVVCVLGADGNVAGLDPRTGRQIWSYPASGGFAAGAAADNGVLYVAEISPHGVTALDVRTGRPRWTSPAPSVASTLLALDGVVAGTPTASPSYDAGQLTFAVDKATGRPLWQANFDTATYSSIAGDGDRVYVVNGTSGTIIDALAARSGAMLWQQTFPDSSLPGTVVAAGGVLYAGFQDGVVRALSPATGADVWHRTTSGAIFNIAPGPRVVYVSDSFPPGTIYAIWP